MKAYLPALGHLSCVTELLHSDFFTMFIMHKLATASSELA